MKKPVEYLKELFEDEPINVEDENSIEYDFLQIIKQAQLDAIEEAVKRCAENVTVECTEAVGVKGMYLFGINIQSILNVAKQLRKEIE